MQSRFTQTSVILGLSALIASCSKEPRATIAATAPSLTEPSPSATASSSARELVEGAPAPEFSATSHTGAQLRLSALRGKPVVVYFYPKDETPGCTKQACAFRDAWKDLEKTGVVLIGISTDSAESHQAFAKHHDLPFHLVSDERGAIAAMFDVPNRAGFLARQSFVIDANGRIKKIYRQVDVTRHARDILADIQP